MLSKDAIRKKLIEDPMWEPEATAPEEEWDLFYEVKDESSTDDEYETNSKESSEDDDDDDLDFDEELDENDADWE